VAGQYEGLTPEKKNAFLYKKDGFFLKLDIFSLNRFSK